MVQNFDVNMPFDQARYNIIKSIDTRDSIGTILTRNDPMVLPIVEKLCSNIMNALIQGNGGVSAFGLDPIQEIYTIINVTKELPYYMLLDIPECEANRFCNSWLIFINTYHDLLAEKLSIIAPDGDAQLSNYFHAVEGLQQGIDVIIRFIELGISYLDLIKATSHLLDEMKKWSNSRPTSLKLSEAYLQSLDFYHRD